MSEPLLHIAPWALLTCVVTIIALWLLLRAFRRHLGLSLALVVAFPLLAALGFVVAISGFMFTEQLGWTLVTCLLIGVMLVPGSVLIGQQFARRTLAIEMRRAEERAREQSHRELIAWISHDLRTPLAGIKAMAEALEDQVVDNPAEVSDYGARIGRESNRLGSMVDDLFELSRISSGALDLRLEPIALDQLVAGGRHQPATGRDQPRHPARRRPAQPRRDGFGTRDGARRAEPDGQRCPAHPAGPVGPGPRRRRPVRRPG